MKPGILRGAVAIVVFGLFAVSYVRASQNIAALSAARPEAWATPIALAGVPNLHKVTDGLYRSAQPTAEGMTNLVALGIKTVVNLRDNHSDSDEIGDLPQKATDDFRITSFPMKADGTPDFDNLVFDPPQSEWNVPGATPKLHGATTLEGPWSEVPSGGDSSMKFFKIVVELP